MASTNRHSGFASVTDVVLKRSHAAEYIGIGVLVILYFTVILPLRPFHRMFYVNDLAISFPHAEVEHVSVFMNFVWALYIPIGVLVAFNLAARSQPHKHEATYLGFVISILVSVVITDIIKNAVGRPRPDLLARCKPAEGTPHDTLVGIEVCTAAPGHDLMDGWRSFPSGHSSFAFSGLGFLSLWLAGQLHIFNIHSRRNLGKAIVCFIPVMGALLIAISRCEDYRHDVYDVTVGSILGSLVAYWSYRRHFPQLSRIDSDEPYPQPSVSSSFGEFTQVGDEESLSLSLDQAHDN
ncbi:Diacylglycerol pyrophosphate phosphatase 1 [Ceratocystis fimbriata CBS 114723]|uniref:Diacylglycerol pyrophosphate phosphatase 1 n=1 Tax=Ceratocystis fimbriata CBS 114723 TaxID=1035309 RepID=A0A2C5WSI0_9PEZI|nr:Diacylglycerol pyrophosphate phosphatase 1 [Ceratocystis fimbriata CBS 114723]